MIQENPCGLPKMIANLVAENGEPRLGKTLRNMDDVRCEFLN